MRGLMAICCVALAACSPAQQDGARATPSNQVVSYDGIKTRLLDGDLVNFQVKMGGAVSQDSLDLYARCAAAQYTLIRGFGFARHVRTYVYEASGKWTADAVYTVSAALPRGVNQVDAEVTVADCEERGIPTV